MFDIQKNIVQPMFIKCIDDFGGYEGEDENVDFVPDFRIKYVNVADIVSIMENVDRLIDDGLGRGDCHIVNINGESYECRYTVATTLGEFVYITQQQFDTLMNEYAIKLY